MAVVGDKLTSPESGMQRIDDTNLNIKYNGTFTQKTDTSKYNNSSTHTTTLGDSIEFYFYGTKFYIIDMYFNTRSNNIGVFIDNNTEENYSAYSTNTTASDNKKVVYKKENLEKGVHHVKILNQSTISQTTMLLDCIDIDEDGYMCTPDGKYIDVTPIMTSNTTGSYVASASSEGQNWGAYKAFNGVTGDANGWASSEVAGWLKLDFGIDTRINSFAIYGNGISENITYLPKNFILYGSNDDSTYNIIKEYTDITNWTKTEPIVFKLDRIVEYRYYKIEISANNGYSTTNIGELRFLLDSETPFYLIQDNTDSKVYNYDDSTTALVEVADTSILAEEVFTNPCISNLSDTLPLLDTLSDDLTILCNNDKKIIAKGIKSTLELIVSKQTLSANIAHLIRELEAICTLVGNGNIKVVVSRDKGNTWSYWDTTTNAWLNLANTVTKRDYNFMTDTEKEKWEALKQEAWQYGMTPDVIKIADFESIKDNGFKFAFVLSRPTYADNATLKELDWTYDEDGGYIVLNNTDILIKKTDKYIKLVPQRNMENIKVEIVN